MPGADLLQSNANDILVADVKEAKHIGRGVIDGVECEHLAFRNADTDWQLWVEVGARPIPRKMVPVGFDHWMNRRTRLRPGASTAWLH